MLNLRNPRLVLCLLAFVPVSAFAQDEDPERDAKAGPESGAEPAPRALEPAGEEHAPTPHEQLGAAMLRFRKQRDLVVRAGIRHAQAEPPAQPGNNNGGNVVQIVMQGPGTGSDQPYEGAVEAWRDEEDTTVVVSGASLPGFEIYRTKERTIRRVTSDGARPGTDQLEAELLSLLDGERFTKHVLKAELAHRIDEATGEHVWSGAVDKHIVRPVRSAGEDPRFAQVLSGMRPRVLRARLELRLSKAGELLRAQVTLVRNDPAREMMRGRLKLKGIVVGGGGVPLPVEEDDDEAEEKHDIEGVSTTYSIDFSAKKASERAVAFKREMRRATGE